MSNEKTDSEIIESAEAWCSPPFDQQTAGQVSEQLEALKAGSESALRDWFSAELSFGTAGIRGLMRPGTGSMNLYTVGRTAAGLAAFIKTGDLIIIGYDGRRNSREYAELSAAILYEAGHKTALVPSLCHTPLVPALIRRFHAAWGIMITSSHNPPDYNGFKVYNSAGAQIIGPVDTHISAEIEKISFTETAETVQRLQNKPLPKEVYLSDTVHTDYITAVAGSSVFSENRDLRIVYTPLGGTGALFMPAVFKAAGFEKVFTVEEENSVDPAFASLPAPNPEIPEVWERSLALARQKKADIVMANDGDADRIGVYYLNREGDYSRLDGNRAGIVLLQYLITELKKKNRLSEKSFAVSTVVSTPLAEVICRRNDVNFHETLTGFKWMGNLAEEKVKDGGDFILAFEEAFGVTFGDSRDKDGITALLLMADLAASLKAGGRDMTSYLEEIDRTYGVYRERLAEVYYEGAQGTAEMQRILSELRDNLPRQIAGSRVAKVRDVLAQTVTTPSDTETITHLPPQNLLTFYLEDGSTVSIRPSGTEPKVKLYISSCTDVTGSLTEARDRVRERLIEIEKQARAFIE